MLPGPTVAGTVGWSLRLPRGGELTLGERPLVVGVVNITPDSFSDGGRWLEPERALRHALDLVEAGADVVDLGAESTRPGGGVYGEGARTVPPGEELARLLPVLEGLRPRTEAAISVDTRKGEVAAAALEAGADLINDISGLSDPELGRAVAEAGCPLILMHSRGELATMQRNIRYDELLDEVGDELTEAMRRAADAGVRRDQMILDPGIGFGKTARQNVELVSRLDLLRELGRPLMVGASRKSFIGDLTGAGVDDRLPGSLAAAAWAALHDVALLRVHDVAETVQFLSVWAALRASSGGAA